MFALTDNNVVDASKSGIESVRKTVYDATQSEEEKKLEEEAKKTFVEKIGGKLSGA